MALTPFNDNLDISVPKPIRIIDRVGVGYKYASPQLIPQGYRYEGLTTMDDDGNTWILIGGIANSNWKKYFRDSAKVILTSQSINAGETLEYTHNLDTEDFIYDYLEYDTTYNCYVKKNPLIEVHRTINSVFLYSISDVDNFKLILIS